MPTAGSRNLLRPPIALHRGTGILTSFPSTTPFGLALGTDSPCADERCAGNLGLTATGLFTLFIATHVSIRTSDTSSRPLDPPSQAYRTLSYRACNPLNSFAGHTDDAAISTLMGALSALSRRQANEFRWIARTRSFGVQFEPRYIFRAGRLDQ